jgi:hypothetical protein
VESDLALAIEWPRGSPTFRGTPEWRACHGYRATYDYPWTSIDDGSERLVARTSGGPAAPVPGLLGPLGDGLVVRADDGALLLDRGVGAPVVLSPPGCKARPFAFDARPGKVGQGWPHGPLRWHELPR